MILKKTLRVIRRVIGYFSYLVLVCIVLVVVPLVKSDYDQLNRAKAYNKEQQVREFLHDSATRTIASHCIGIPILIGMFFALARWGTRKEMSVKEMLQDANIEDKGREEILDIDNSHEVNRRLGEKRKSSLLKIVCLSVFKPALSWPLFIISILLLASSVAFFCKVDGLARNAIFRTLSVWCLIVGLVFLLVSLASFVKNSSKKNIESV